MFRHWLFLLLAVAAPAEEWTRFRGPNGTGISADKGFPIEFGKEKNLIWRTPVRSGKSSPVLTKTRVFLTGFENLGAQRTARAQARRAATQPSRRHHARHGW
jgi:outer membrane protein assembly factor BamB